MTPQDLINHKLLTDLMVFSKKKLAKTLAVWIFCYFSIPILIRGLSLSEHIIAVVQELPFVQKTLDTD